MTAALATVISACHRGADAKRAERRASPAGRPRLFGVFVMTSSLRRDAGYVIVTLSCWDFWTNWAAGSEELMFTTNWPAPGAEPRPCTVMFAVAFEPNCPTVQCTDVVPP